MEPGSRLGADETQPREIDDLTLRRAQRRDERACRALVSHYQRPVFALLDRMLCGCGRRGLVDELAQQTFLRVLRELPQFSIGGAARLSRWILTVAMDLALDEARRRPASALLRDAADLPEPALLRDAADPPEPALLRDAADPPEPECSVAVAGQRDLGAVIRHAAAVLPAESRAVLLLHDYHEFEDQEIARILKIDLGTVKSRLWRARAAIRTAVQGTASEAADE
jgi:RNA polymerase sigma-70 factor, ECF subfamily